MWVIPWTCLHRKRGSAAIGVEQRAWIFLGWSLPPTSFSWLGPGIRHVAWAATLVMMARGSSQRDVTQRGCLQQTIHRWAKTYVHERTGRTVFTFLVVGLLHGLEPGCVHAPCHFQAGTRAAVMVHLLVHTRCQRFSRVWVCACMYRIVTENCCGVPLGCPWRCVCAL